VEQVRKVTETLKPIEKTTLGKMTNLDEEDQTYLQSHRDESNADEISKLVINELLDQKKLKSNSRIKFDQVSKIVKLNLFSTTFHDGGFSKSIGDLMLELQISIQGKGRQELIQAVQRREMFEMQPQTKQSKDIFR